MTKRTAALAAGVVAIALILYFSWSALVRKYAAPPAPASTAAAQEKPGAMAGMPGMPAEKQQAQAAQPEATAPEPPTVEIPPEKQQLIGVKTTPAQVAAPHEDDPHGGARRV